MTPAGLGCTAIRWASWPTPAACCLGCRNHRRPPSSSSWPITDTPLLFLHNTTGYMLVGKDYEEGGMIKHGSMMINAVSNPTVPAHPCWIGASYGAGH